MGSETVIQRISFKYFYGLFLRDFCDINLRGTVYLYFSVLHTVLLFLLLQIKIVNNFKACWFNFHLFLVTPGL